MLKPPARVPIDALVDLACRDGVDIRPTLLRVLTDLYVQKPLHDADEETQYVELALGLIDAVDAQTCSAVAVTLSAYPGAPASVLLKLAGGGPAGTRAARARNDLIDLFFTTNADERRLILRNLDIAPGPAARPQMPVAGELLRRLEAAALARNPGEFARVLARALKINGELATRIARDDSGEPVIVAAKALAMQADALQRILLFLNPVIGQSSARIYELSRLFEEITPASAWHMLSIWRTMAPEATAQASARRPARAFEQAPAQAAAAVRAPVHPSAHAAGQARAHASAGARTRSAAHEPVYWDDERPDVRSPSQGAPSRAPAEREVRLSPTWKAK